MAETLFLVERLIEEIKAKVKALSYIDECYGMVHILTALKDSKTIVYPAIYIDGSQYLSMLPDSNLGNYAFVLVKEPYKHINFAKNKVNKLKADFALIFWYDIRSVNIEDSRSIEEVKSDLMYLLTHSTYRNGTVELSEITIDRKRIYEEFTTNEIKEQFLMYPYAALRINGMLYFTEQCEIDGVIYPPNYETLITENHSSAEAYILAAQAYQLAEQAVSGSVTSVNGETGAVTLTKEDIDGIQVEDSPEFADVEISTLYGGEPVGAFDDYIWEWLQATPKSVLSVLLQLTYKMYALVAALGNKVDKVTGKGLSTNDFTNDYANAVIFATPRLNQTLTGAILLDRAITQYNNLTLTGALELSVGANPLVEGAAEGVIIGNGTNTPTLNGITIWATSAAFDATNLKQNHFMVWKQGDGVYIAWTQKN